jgi:hypothetical protein
VERMAEAVAAGRGGVASAGAGAGERQRHPPPPMLARVIPLREVDGEASRGLHRCEGRQ